MAWRCTGATNAELINNMAKNEIITSERVRLVSMNTSCKDNGPY